MSKTMNAAEPTADQQLAEARATLRLRQQRAEAAAGKQAELRADVAAGDESIAAGDLSAAAAEAEHSALLVKAAETAVRKAKDVVAREVNVIYAGVIADALHARFGVAEVVSQHPEEAPMASFTVRALGAGKGRDPYRGTIEGEVEVKLWLPEFLAPPNPENIAEAFAAFYGVRVSGGFAGKYRVSGAAFEPIPTLSTALPASHSINHIGESVAARIEQTFGFGPSVSRGVRAGQSGDTGASFRGEPNLVVRCQSTRITSDSIDRDGLRRMRAEVAISAAPLLLSTFTGDPKQALRDGLEAAIGGRTDAGAIESVEIVRLGKLRSQSGDEVDQVQATLVIVSRPA